MTGRGLPDSFLRELEGRYRIGRMLGEGGSAAVYLATDLKHDRPVAVKVLHAELTVAVGASRFVREIRTTAGLRHPHILPLFDSGEARGLPFYVMPFVEGETLRTRLDRTGALPLDEALTLFRDVASAVAYAHARGVVHRDLKPANVLLGEGGALVADFGVASALSGAGPERLTVTGRPIGTPGYMSPEQLEGGEVGPASDQFALASLLHEMLAGAPAFQGSTLQAVVAQILTGTPVSLGDLRPDAPDRVVAAVGRGLKKRPEARFPSVEALARECEPTSAPEVGRRRPGVGLALAAVAIMVAAVGGWFVWGSIQRADARSELLEVGQLIREARYTEAYELAARAERWIPEDSLLSEYLNRASDLLSVTSDPPGAQVFLQRYDPAVGATTEPLLLGTTPLTDVRIPRTDHRLVVREAGFAPVERMVSSELSREAVPHAEGRRVALELELQPEGELPAAMVAVPGGPYQLASADVPRGISRDLDSFFIDTYEVTNEEYATFVRAGGYAATDLWSDAGREIRGGFTDRTGLPGPRDWISQSYPDGLGRHPVVGVTWYEAQAFCRSREKRLPTVFEWEKTARDGRSSAMSVRMPWGVARSASREVERANFSSDGTAPVDAFPFGLSPYGAYVMAGNVREWISNPSGDGRVVAGGSWQGPAYVYSEYSVESPDFASPGLGFRCARSAGSGDPEAQALKLDQPPPTYEPVNRATFERYLEQFRYDPISPRPRVGEVEVAEYWTRERIWIDGPAADSILLYLYLPNTSAPPYQTMVYLTSSATLAWLSVPEEVEWVLGPMIQGGRAVLAPVLRGRVENSFPDGYSYPAPPTVAFRDLLVRHATEMRLAMDYAETRTEVDGDALTYGSFSWGAGSRLVLSAVDERFKAVVYIGGGIDERVKPTLPEADNVNYAPYVDVPTLLLNGSNDEEHTWQSRGLPLWNLMTEPKELVLVEGAGHLPPVETRIPAINRFLDRVVAPVERR